MSTMDDCSLARSLKYDVNRLDSKADRLEESTSELRKQGWDFRLKYVDRSELKQCFFLAGLVGLLALEIALFIAVPALVRSSDLSKEVKQLSAEVQQISEAQESAEAVEEEPSPGGAVSKQSSHG